MRKLKALTIDHDLIRQSMRDISRQFNDYYLDTNSGKVIALSRQLIASFESNDRQIESTLPRWDAEMIPLGREIILKGSPNYVRVPEAFGQPEHQWMIEFAKDLRPPKLKERVLKSLQGRGSCSRFKDSLTDYPDELRRYTMIRNRYWKERIQNWLESIGILGVEEKPRKVRSAAN